MAVVAMEGFDIYNNSAQMLAKDNRASDGIGSFPAGRLAGRCYRANGVNALKINLPSTYSTLIAGFAFRTSGFETSYPKLHLRAAGTYAIKLSFKLSGGNYVWQLTNVSDTVLGTGTTALSVNVWYYIELKVVVSATVGTVELRLNGSSTAEISATGLNTGATNLDSIWCNGGATHDFDYDDVYAVDTTGSAPTNTWLGDVRVETLIPNGDGANTAWTGTSTDIDDTTTHDSDTTYISSSTPGDRETATMTNLAIATGTVYAVQTNLAVRKDDAGARTVAPVLRIGGVNYDGTTSSALSTSYVGLTQMYDRLDPSTAAWTAATVNAMEAGVKEVA